MTDALALKLSGFMSKGYVIAPAGYGKTHLIALAVGAAVDKQLILTHTYAGVNSIKEKMRNIGVTSDKYLVDTIASWALRLCLSYPQNSEWEMQHPTNSDWKKLYKSCTKLLGKKFIQRIVSSSFSGVYVDEYQDCTMQQHELICALAEFLPCRILGDPLQAIFDFSDEPIDWDKYVYPYFECLGELNLPWRWYKAGSPRGFS